MILKWAPLLLWIAAAPAAATPGAFARQQGFLEGDLLPQISLGSLLHVDTTEGRPSRIRKVCSPRQLGLNHASRRSALPNYAAHVGLGEMPLDDLTFFLDSVNNALNDDALIALHMDVDRPEIHAYADADLPQSLNDLSRDCLIAISRILHENLGERRNIVVLDAALVADIDVHAVWHRGSPSLAHRVEVMGQLADFLALNGGQVGDSRLRAPFQRIGWRHDSGDWFRSVSVGER